MPTSFQKARDLLFKFTALTLVAVAITKAFTPSTKKRKRSMRPKRIHVEAYTYALHVLGLWRVVGRACLFGRRAGAL